MASAIQMLSHESVYIYTLYFFYQNEGAVTQREIIQLPWLQTSFSLFVCIEYAAILVPCISETPLISA
jgi:hypothetical protein